MNNVNDMIQAIRNSNIQQDMKEEIIVWINNNRIKHTYENCHNATCKDKSYNQGRVDALDEMLEFYKTNYEKVRETKNGHEPWSYWRSIIERLEKLKEKN